MIGCWSRSFSNTSAAVDSAQARVDAVKAGASAEQVAVAVIAEIQACLNGREGGLLRERSGAIHAQENASAEAEKFSVQSIACA